MGNDVVVALKRNWRHWADRINGAWQKGVESIIETGKLLIEAKEGPDALPHGEFESMVQLKLNFAPSTARSLMIIARHPVISNRRHADDLPPSWDTLYRLTTLDKKLGEGTLLAKIKDGTITPKLERRDVTAMIQASAAARSAPSSRATRAGKPMRLDAARRAYVAAAKSLSKDERRSELIKLMDALELNLARDFVQSMIIRR